MSRRLLPTLIGGLALAGLAAPGPAAAQDEAPPADTLVLRSRGPDLLFLPDRLTARAGARVLLRYVNEGDLPHNLAIAKDDADVDLLVNAAYQAQESGFVPREHEDLMIAWTGLLSPGDTAEIVFTVPPPGVYTYVCLFPGHGSMMLGTLRSIG